MKPKQDNSKNEKDSFFCAYMDSLKMIFLPTHITWSHYIIKKTLPALQSVQCTDREEDHHQRFFNHHRRVTDETATMRLDRDRNCAQPAKT